MTFSAKEAFGGTTEEEKKAKADRLKQNLKEIQEAYTAAKACLESELFKDYWQKLLRSRDAMVNMIIAIEGPTIEAEWKEFKELQIHLRQLEYLVTEIERDLKIAAAQPQKENS